MMKSLKTGTSTSQSRLYAITTKKRFIRRILIVLTRPRVVCRHVKLCYSFRRTRQESSSTNYRLRRGAATSLRRLLGRMGELS